MTITSTPSEIAYSGDNVSTTFPIPFPFDAASDLKVIRADATGNLTVLTSGFTVSGGGGSTGSLTLTSALATGFKLTILDEPLRAQLADYIANDDFPAEAHEKALDRGVRISKRLWQLVQRCIRTADGDPVTDLTLGSVDNRKGKYLFFNAVTGAIEYAVNIVNTILSQSIIAQLLNPQTPAEITAGVTPVNYAYATLTVDRYGTNTTPGTTDMTAAIKAAWNVAKAQGGGKITFAKGVQYALSSLDPASPINLANQNNDGTVGTQAYATQVYCLGGSNITFDLQGAQLKSTITGGGVGLLFDNCTNTRLISPNMTGTQVQSGGVVSVGAITAGSGYVNGTYTNVLMTGGTGQGCCCTIVVSGGAVTSVTPTYPGGSTTASLANGYQVNDTLSTPNTNLGGSGSGFSVKVASSTGAGNIVATASVLPFCVTSLSGLSSGFTAYDLTTNNCFTGFSVLDGTNGNVSSGISLLGHTTIINGEYGATLQRGGDDTFIENLSTFRVNRPFFFYGVQNATIATLDAQQTNFGFGAIIKTYNRLTRNITVNGSYQNAPGNPTARISIQVQCDPAVFPTPPTVENVYITYDEQNENAGSTAIEFDFFSGTGGNTLTATSAKQLFDQIFIRGFSQGTILSTVQLTTAAAQCQINYDNFEANWSAVVGGGQDVRNGLGFIASREFFCNVGLKFGSVTATAGGFTQCFIADGFCKVQATITLTNKNSGTGQATVVLPFTSRLDNTTFSVCPVLGLSGMSGLSGGMMVGVLPANSNQMNLYYQAATGAQSVVDTNFTLISCTIYVDVTYPI